MMTWFTWIFLESALALGAVSGTALFFLLVYWRRGGSVQPLLIGLGVSVVLFAVQALVTTQREHAAGVMQAIEDDLVDAQTAALGQYLAPQFTAGNRDRREFLDHVSARLKQIDIRWLDRKSLKIIESSGDTFAVAVGYFAHVTGEYGGTVPSVWRIEFTRTPDGWLISQIDCLKLAWMENPTWEQIDRQ